MNDRAGRLQHLPVPLFSSVMGIGGLSLAWQRAARSYDVPEAISSSIFWLAAAIFVVLVVAYGAKWLRHPAAAWAEARHPIRMTFVPTITIAALVLAVAGQTAVPEVARGLWWFGAVGHLTLTVVILSAWFNRQDIRLEHMTPAWFIPIVGNVVTPLAAPQVGSIELAWLAFGVGVMFWLALLPVLLFRLLLHDEPMPLKLLPSLAIFVAPPAVTLLSWTTLTGRPLDPVARLLYAATLVFTALVLVQLPRLRSVPFSVPYWAYTFPAAAASTAALEFASLDPLRAYDVVAIALLAMTTTVALWVLVLTLRAAVRGELCVPD